MPYLQEHSTILTINVTTYPALPFINSSFSSINEHDTDILEATSSKFSARTRLLHNTSLSVDIINPIVVDLNYSVLYEVFLTYMYEGDMKEDQYWKVLIDTNTPLGLKQNATKVRITVQIAS